MLTGPDWPDNVREPSPPKQFGGLMRKRAVVGFIAALALIAGCSVESVPEDSKASSDAAALSDADIAAVKGQVDAFVKALLAKDWAAFGQTLTTDYIAYPPNQPPVRGRDANIEY